MATNAPARMKKLINNVEDIVPESLAGLQAAHPAIVRIDTAQNVVLRAGGARAGKVGLVSGGGKASRDSHVANEVVSIRDKGALGIRVACVTDVAGADR